MIVHYIAVHVHAQRERVLVMLVPRLLPPFWRSESGDMQMAFLKWWATMMPWSASILRQSQEHCPKGGGLWGMMKKAPPLAPSIWDTNMRPGSNLHIFREDLELTQNFMPQIWMASGSQSGRSWCFGHRFLSTAVPPLFWANSPPRTHWCNPCNVPQRTVALRCPWRTSNRRTWDPYRDDIILGLLHPVHEDLHSNTGWWLPWPAPVILNPCVGPFLLIL